MKNYITNTTTTTVNSPPTHMRRVPGSTANSSNSSSRVSSPLKKPIKNHEHISENIYTSESENKNNSTDKNESLLSPIDEQLTRQQVKSHLRDLGYKDDIPEHILNDFMKELKEAYQEQMEKIISTELTKSFGEMNMNSRPTKTKDIKHTFSDVPGKFNQGKQLNSLEQKTKSASYIQSENNTKAKLQRTSPPRPIPSKSSDPTDFSYMKPPPPPSLHFTNSSSPSTQKMSSTSTNTRQQALKQNLASSSPTIMQSKKLETFHQEIRNGQQKRFNLNSGSHNQQKHLSSVQTGSAQSKETSYQNSSSTISSKLQNKNLGELKKTIEAQKKILERLENPKNEHPQTHLSQGIPKTYGKAGLKNEIYNEINGHYTDDFEGDDEEAFKNENSEYTYEEDFEDDEFNSKQNEMKSKLKRKKTFLKTWFFFKKK